MLYYRPNIEHASHVLFQISCSNRSMNNNVVLFCNISYSSYFYCTMLRKSCRYSLFYTENDFKLYFKVLAFSYCSNCANFGIFCSERIVTINQKWPRSIMYLSIIVVPLKCLLKNPDIKSEGDSHSLFRSIVVMFILTFFPIFYCTFNASKV